MSRRTTSILACGVLFGLVSSFFLVHRIQAVFPSSSMEDVLFVSSPEVVKHASLGYSGLLADIYWMRVVQYFGSKHERESMQYKALAPLLDITTTLDPHLVIAYEWGATFLDQPPPSGAGDDNAAIALLRKGIRNNPDNWRLYMTLGFIQYESLHDNLAAAKTFEEGAKVPHTNPSMKVMAAKVLTDAGSFETARYLWESIYEEATDKDIKRNAGVHLACLAVDEELPKLQAFVDAFRARFGRYPHSWLELISTGAVRVTPRDPMGEPYLLQHDGRVMVANPKQLPFIHQGKPS